MSKFTQLHFLTSYPPSNPNRDDLGRPKTATMGGVQRLRISSQCLKRTWRTSDLFEEALGEHIGTRTKDLGPYVYNRLVEGGRTEKQALSATKKIAEPFGEVEGKKNYHKHKQLVHFSPNEWQAVDNLIETLIDEGRAPKDEEVDLLRKEHSAVDIAMFGRMLAKTPTKNTDGTVQVNHALSVHEAQVEDDFFSAVDDLNEDREDAGAAHLGEKEFGAGLYYLYVCIDRDMLVENLQGNEELANRAVRALVEAAATVAPSGMQNSYGSRTRASYILAEKGDQQPRSLHAAFLEPVNGEAQRKSAIGAIKTESERLDRAYGTCADDRYVLDVPGEEGTLDELLDFVASNGGANHG